MLHSAGVISHPADSRWASQCQSGNNIFASTRWLGTPALTPIVTQFGPSCKTGKPPGISQCTLLRYPANLASTSAFTLGAEPDPVGKNQL